MGDERVFAAVDLGASGGRVVAGLVSEAAVRIEEIHRFPNGVVHEDGHLRWDIRGLYDEALVGLGRLARRYPQVESIGIDSWAVDYALLDGSGNLLGNPIAYRDARTGAAVEAVHAKVPHGELYTIDGLQFLPFNTLYQLVAEQGTDRWEHAARVVLLPDLVAFWLTGQLATEATNASTTGLVDVRTGNWSEPLLDLLEIPRRLLPDIEAPGAVRGPVRPDLCDALGLRSGTVVTTVGSHDTASAVVALPADGRPFAYVASGTWSLVGLELPHPIVDTEARRANFTNEGGVDGRTRFLRNVGGLWLLQESLRTWAAQGVEPALGDLVAAAAALPAGGPTIDVDDGAFIAPGDMPRRIADAIGDPDVASDPVRLTRCVVDSLAVAYAHTVETASRLARRPVEVVHLVGGGSRNRLLCQLAADQTGLPVTAGPVEATALGNVLVQARAHGAAPEALDDLRGLVAVGGEVRTHVPGEPVEALR
jgi:rhamnulokinase